MNEHPVLVPTSVGAVAGIVTEPAGTVRAAALVLAGAGGCGHSGVNAFWTRIARELGELGIASLRCDHPHRGNGSTAVPGEIDAQAREDARESIDVEAAREASAWFRERLEGLDFLLVGECHGGRVAFELLPQIPSVAGLFTVVPYLRDEFVPLSAREAPESPDEEQIQILDEPMLDSLRGMLEDGRPVWIAIGAEEGDDPARLRRRLGEAGRLLEIDVIPDHKVHPVASAAVQAEVSSRLIPRIALSLDGQVSERAPR